MDQLDAPFPTGPAPGMEPPKVGRPSMDATKRAISDEKYQKMVDLLDALPDSAKEYRFAIYRSRRHQEAKASFRPLERIYFTKFQSENFKDEATLGNYLGDKYGPGRYFIEPLDEHNQRINKMPCWVVRGGNEDDMDDGDDDDFGDEQRPGWSRGRRRRDDDDEDDDPREARANMADLLTTVGKQNAAQVATVAKSGNDIFSIMMLTQSQAQESRAAEERRREEQRVDERRREDQRAEDRRREQETERKEREERENRRREDDRKDREAADARRQADNIAMMQAANKRTEIIVAAVAAAAPVIGKLFEKKEDQTLPLLIKSMEKKEDPVMLMLLKGMMDKAHDDSATKNMITQFGEMSKMTSAMGQEQMRSVLALSNDINGAMMKKAMDMMLSSPQGQTPEGKSIIEQVMSAVAGAADIVKVLVPQQQQQPPARLAQHQPAIAANIAAPTVTPTAAPAAESEKTRTEIAWEAMTPEQRAAAEAQTPRGAEAVVQAIYAIQQQKYQSQAEYQELIKYLVTEMPLDLRVAVLDANESMLMGIMQPIVMKTPALVTWIMQPGVADWIRTFVSQLPPSLEGIHGPAAAQREQYVAALAAQKSAETAPVADATPAPTGEAAPVATVDVTGATAVEVAPTPSVTDAPPATTESASHLDHDPDAP